MSYVLWDAPPDAELTAAALGASLAQNEMLAVQAERLSSDSRAVQILARFFGQWLHVDTDLRLEAPEFEQSPDYLEWLAFVEYAAANAVPVKEFIGSTRGFVHQQNVEAYALDTIDGDGDVVSVEWPVTSGRRGLLGQELLAGATRHPDTSRREIFRGLLVRRSLLCDPIPSPSAALIALAGEVGDRTTDVRCKNCHERIDPIGRAFASLDLDGDEPVPVAEVLFHDELEGSYQSLGELLEAVAASRAFAACFSRHWLAFFLERDINDIDAAWVAQLADAVESGASLGEVVERTLLQLAAPSSLAEPWCEAP
jgi:hypothetical protein